MVTDKDILLVDDDADLIACTRTMLESAGYGVLAAGSAAEARELIQECKPDLIVLDVMMGTESEGFDFSYELRGNPDTADIPIILLTGVSEKTGMDFAADKDSEFIQADEFLEKPVKPQVLFDKVAELLGVKPEG